MLNKFTFLIALLAVSLQVKAQDYTRCMASPDPVTILQPDGTELTVIGYGNMDVNYTETEDGYTVVKNKAGIYEYAIQTTDGDLKATGIKARQTSQRTTSELQYLKTQPLHLKYSEEKLEKLLNKTAARSKQIIKPADGHDHDHEHDASVTASFPSLGKRKVLLLLIQYPDMKARFTRDDFDNMMNKANYRNIGSYKDFYARNSFGKLDLDTDVFGWYTASNNYAYYSNSNGMARSRELVAQALDAAKAQGVDFSQYDNDKDGQADGILIVHAGPGAEEGSQNQFIWSHRWSLANHKRTYDGVVIDNYAINPETRGGSNTRMVGIGVFCHEFGHLLGLPDLYDVNQRSEGIGNWSVMAGGNWLNNEYTPSNFCAFTRVHLKWINPLTIEDEGYYTLKPSSKDSLIYRINTPVKHEYFLLENRQLTGFDARLNGKGMAIWHINDSVFASGIWGNTVNGNVNKKAVDLEEADGKNDLDRKVNRGDGGDLFPGTAKKTSFSDNTTPNARNYNNNNTGINIFNITTLPDSSVRFGYSGTPRISFTAPEQVCQNVVVNFSNTSKFASRFSWQIKEGIIDTLKNASYKFTAPGDHYVKLKGTSLAGVEVNDSVKITVLPAASANFKAKSVGYITELTNNSQNTENTLIYWGDGTSTNQAFSTISHTYTDTGLYKITMICYSKDGCTDTMRTSVRLPAVLPGDPIALQAYPNPFYDKLKLHFVVSEDAPVSMSFYNIIGQEVINIPSKNYEAGAHLVELSLQEQRLPSGTYILKMFVNNKPAQVKIMKW